MVREPKIRRPGSFDEVPEETLTPKGKTVWDNHLVVHCPTCDQYSRTDMENADCFLCHGRLVVKQNLLDDPKWASEHPLAGLIPESRWRNWKGGRL